MPYRFIFGIFAVAIASITVTQVVDTISDEHTKSARVAYCANYVAPNDVEAYHDCVG